VGEGNGWGCHEMGFKVGGELQGRGVVTAPGQQKEPLARQGQPRLSHGIDKIPAPASGALSCPYMFSGVCSLLGGICQNEGTGPYLAAQLQLLTPLRGNTALVCLAAEWVPLSQQTTCSSCFKLHSFWWSLPPKPPATNHTERKCTLFAVGRRG